MDPPQSLICIGITLCKIIRALISYNTGVFQKKIDKHWKGIQAYLISLCMLDESTVNTNSNQNSRELAQEKLSGKLNSMKS